MAPRRVHGIAVMSLMVAAVAAAPLWAAPDESEVLTALQTRIEKVSETVGRSVVSIQIKGKAASPGGEGFSDDLFDMLPPDWRRHFERRRTPTTPDRQRQGQEELVPRGLGSGVIISADGYIVTNQHVVAEAEEIEVTLSDKRHFKATRVGEDPRRDLAVLKIDAADLPAAELAPGDVRRGMFVLAIGNPFGFGAEGQASVSFGIVSGTRRSLALAMQEDRYYGKLIQTDAAINPGNSGGALCDLEGKVIGINVAIASRTGGSQGVGFAIPVDKLTLSIIDKLKQGKSVEYGYLGVGIRNPTAAESETAGAPPGIGAFVVSVEPGGPAETAGVMPADLIVALDGAGLKDADDLVSDIGRAEPGKEVKLTLHRSGKQMDVTAKVVRRDPGGIASTGARQPGSGGASAGAYTWRGMALRDLTPALRSEAGVGDDAAGVFVDNVDKDSPAYASGIRAGSVIDQVGSRKVKDVDDFKKAVAKLQGKVFVNVVGRGPEIVGE